MMHTYSFRRCVGRYLFSSVVLLAASSAHAGTYTANYLGGGIWEQDGKWSTTAYPNNGHFVVVGGNPFPDSSPIYNVSIDNAAPCTLAIGVTVQTVNIAHGSTLNLANAARINANTGLGNNGIIKLNSTGDGSQLRLAHGSVIGATGQVLMSDSATNYVSAINHGDTLTIAAGGLIRGAGQLNLGYFGDTEHLLNFVNHGLIDAVGPNNALQIGLGKGVGSSLTNDSIVRASLNSILRIHAFGGIGAVDNAGGMLSATDNAQVRVAAGVTVTGGTLATSGGGTIRGDGPGGGGGILKDLTNTGEVLIANSEALTFAGTFTNNGTVNLASTGGGAILSFATGATLAGTGTINLSKDGGNFIYGAAGGDAVTIAAGATIQGAGQISPGFSGGSNMAKIMNQGLVDANVSNAGLNIRVENSNGTDFTNTGTLRASNGGTLSFSGSGSFFNTGGTLNALDGSTVRIGANVTINGGTVTSSGTGAIGGAGPGAGGGTLLDVTNTGTVLIADGEALGIAGTFTNNGSLSMASGGNGATLHFANGSTLAGTGAVMLSKNGTNSITGLNGGEAVTIAPGATIEGAGNISPGFSGGGNMLKITNKGLIAANLSGAALTVRAETSNNTNFTNSGTLRASNGGTLHFTGGGSITNDGGTLDIEAGSTMSSAGANPFAQTSGTTNLDGTLTLPQGLDLHGGQLIGNGTINGDVRNAGGTLSPGHSPGKLTVNGNYTQGANSIANMEIAGAVSGSSYDQLVVSGNATLGGTLNITAINGFKPAAGDIYTLISAGSFSGSFATVKVNGFTGKIDSSSNGITLTVTSTARQLLNISTRMEVLTGENVLIGGFIITGTEAKKVLIRGLGPELPVAGQLQDTILELHHGSTVMATNDDWRATQEQEIKDTTVPPSDDRESAIVQTLQPGGYTAVLSGKGEGTGAGQVEVYDLTAASASQLANISTRGLVDTGDNVMIGGVIIGGGSAGTTTHVLVRAIGPSLESQGVDEALQDPTLELRDGNGQLVAQNDNWRDSQERAIKDTTAAPTDDRESAIVRTVGAGKYTAIVRGKENSTGVALVELYNLP